MKRLFTDTDMHNTTMREEIEDFYDYLQRLIRIDDLSIPSKNYDLVLDIMVTDDERISWSYYYACHDARCLFWLETYDASHMISELFGVKSPAHVSALHSQILNLFLVFPIKCGVQSTVLSPFIGGSSVFYRISVVVKGLILSG